MFKYLTNSVVRHPSSFLSWSMLLSIQSFLSSSLSSLCLSILSSLTFLLTLCLPIPSFLHHSHIFCRCVQVSNSCSAYRSPSCLLIPPSISPPPALPISLPLTPSYLFPSHPVNFPSPSTSTNTALSLSAYSLSLTSLLLFTPQVIIPNKYFTL